MKTYNRDGTLCFESYAVAASCAQDSQSVAIEKTYYAHNIVISNTDDEIILQLAMFTLITDEAYKLAFSTISELLTYMSSNMPNAKISATGYCLTGSLNKIHLTAVCVSSANSLQCEYLNSTMNLYTSCIVSGEYLNELSISDTVTSITSAAASQAS